MRDDAVLRRALPLGRGLGRANVDLFVVCKEVIVDSVSVEQLLYIFCICYELWYSNGTDN